MHDAHEIERLRTLLEYGILDTPYEEDFDGLARLASFICDTPMALISMIDDKRQWYKAKVGMARNEVPVEETFCQYTIAQNNLFEIEDASVDPVLKDNPNVSGEDGVRFYAGLPLTSDNGYNIGTLCVVDTRSRKLSDEQKEALSIIAKQVMLLLEFRRRNKDLGEELNVVLQQRIEEKERELLRKDAEYSSLRKAINKSSGVVEFLPDGTIVRVNANFEEIIGYKEEELLGRHHSVILEQSEREKNELFWQSLREGTFRSGRFKRLHKSGELRWIQASYNPIVDDKEEVVRIVKIAQNITTEIASNIALEQAKKMADDLNVQKDFFIANMSHEIRTPINAILGFTELLMQREEDAQKVEQLQAVKTAGDNLLFIVNDILDLSKIEAGMLQIENSRFDLRETVANVFSMLRLRAEQKKLKFSYHLPEELPHWLMGDKNRLTQVLINLLGNAIKFTNKGKVDLDVRLVRSTTRRCTVQFVVKDTGIGIAPDKQRLIFERFTQAEASTSRKFGGTGLGLNISRLLVEKQNGTIELESKLGKGSVFSFTLTYGKAKKRSGLEEQAVVGFTNNRSLRILLCEDNLLNQKLVSAILDETQHVLDIAYNGLKGLELFRKQPYDLVLMDLQMPDMNGYDTTKIIREELQSEIPIIALTAHSMIAERTRCLEMGMSDYLSKPFRKAELLEKINQWGTRTAGAKNDVQQRVNPYTHFSVNNLREFSGGNPEFEKEVIQLFLEQNRQAMSEISAAIDQNDCASVAATAHRLRSSYGMIGANTSLLETMESEAKGKKIKDFPKILYKLALQSTLLTDELKRFLQTIET